MPDDEKPDLSEIRLREEVRAEVEADFHRRDELAQVRDRRARALLVSFTLLAGVLVPFVGLILGVAIRVFRWAAGF